MKSTRILIAAVVASLAMYASADYLVYWEVDGATDMYTLNKISFTYATISAVDSSGSATALYQYDSDSKKVSPETYRVYADADDDTSAGPTYSGSSTSLDSYDSFLVSLYSSDSLVGWKTFSTAEVLAHMWDTSGTGTQTSSPLTATSFVPEPTSAMLTLLGLAALALRRRRA